MEEKKSTHIAGSIVCGLLTAVGGVTCAISLLGGSKSIWLLGDCVQVIIYSLIAYYAFYGYKKPHGNLLKYTILLFAAGCVVVIPTLTERGNTAIVVLYAILIGLLCYIAGRLAKAKENLIVMIIATLCIATTIGIEIVVGVANIGAVSSLTIWLDICVAYFLRYKEHREAGLADAEKK